MFRARPLSFALLISLVAGMVAAGQQAPTIGAEVAGRHIFGPPPPEAPEIQTRDAATGLTTVRAT
ncbi:MAG: hypothetical protein Q7J25_09070, partial [Vicinamibacterales bacterium]|nr:hypothetical protein [Vicinamibacterales bacterium]